MSFFIPVLVVEAGAGKAEETLVETSEGMLAVKVMVRMEGSSSPSLVLPAALSSAREGLPI